MARDRTEVPIAQAAATSEAIPAKAIIVDMPRSRQLP